MRHWNGYEYYSWWFAQWPLGNFYDKSTGGYCCVQFITSSRELRNKSVNEGNPICRLKIKLHSWERQMYTSGEWVVEIKDKADGDRSLTVEEGGETTPGCVVLVNPWSNSAGRIKRDINTSTIQLLQHFSDYVRSYRQTKLHSSCLSYPALNCHRVFCSPYILSTSSPKLFGSPF